MPFREVPISSQQRFLFLGVLLFMVSGSLSPAENKQEDILRPWIEKQSRIRTLHATFVQTRRLPMVKFSVRNSGEIWFGPKGWFRWQVGSPPDLLAIQGPEGLALVQPSKRRARIFHPGVPDSQAAPFATISLPFASSYSEFSKRFKVLKLHAEKDRVEVNLRPSDPITSTHLVNIRVVFDPSTSVVTVFALQLSDGSEIVTELSEVECNIKIPEAMFEFDFEGYQIDDQRKPLAP